MRPKIQVFRLAWVLRRVVHDEFPHTKMGKLRFVDVYHVAKSAPEALLSLRFSPSHGLFTLQEAGKGGSEASNASSLIRDGRSRFQPLISSERVLSL